MALKTPQHTTDTLPSQVFADVKDDMATLEGALDANLNGATAQLTPASGKVPMGDGAGKIPRGWMPDGLGKRSTNLSTDYPLQTWSDSLDNGKYDVSLSVPQNGLPIGYWYIDVQRHINDNVANQFRTLTAISFGSGNTPNQVYRSTCKNSVWTPFMRQTADEPLTWITPTLLNGWLDFTAGWNALIAKDSAGTVFSKGLIKSGSIINLTTLFILPVGMRPLTSLSFSERASGGFVNIQVKPSGEVQILNYTGNPTGYTGITFNFKAEQ